MRHCQDENPHIDETTPPEQITTGEKLLEQKITKARETKAELEALGWSAELDEVTGELKITPPGTTRTDEQEG